jgi:iron complex outermembrane receptor protein
MSELIQKHDNRATIRWKLLTGASALALAGYVASSIAAKAEDTDRPQVWIELGGQLSRLEDSQETFTAPVFNNRPSIFAPSQQFERPPLYAFSEFASLSFQPAESNWIFGASIQYGRSASARNVHQQTYPYPFVKYDPFHPSLISLKNVRNPLAAEFADTQARSSEQHLILDFTAGKDVGLGMFGKDSTSTVSLGVRFAQFRSKSNIALKSDPDWHFRYKYITLPNTSVYPYTYATNFKVTSGQAYHSNRARFAARRSFRGVGPSISWKSSVPIAGNMQDGAITLDWGLNAALLFGRQKTETHHQSTAIYHRVKGQFFGVNAHSTQYHTFPDQDRSRNVTVPNAGAFAGLSYVYSDAKISFGYKADFFFGAMDGGIDAAKKENVGFNGPYASISIGIGN